MSAWPGKFVIGLSGNIATGKSVVRRMLEHAGAFGIDADALSHRALQRGAPGYQQIVDAFGRYILDETEEIDRAKLGAIVFGDEDALRLLESIVHPIVRQAVDVLVRKSKSHVVVIEAIKLLESPLRPACDVVWVVIADEQQQLRRLAANRDMLEGEARKRMAAQSAQSEKVAAADTVIDNRGSIEQTWEQVKAAWKELFPEAEGETVPARIRPGEVLDTDKLRLNRARPRQAGEIAAFISGINGSDTRVTRQQIMDSFGEKAYLILEEEEAFKALVGWKVENLVARVDEFHFAPGLNMAEILPFLVNEIEEASRELQCEIILVFVSPQLAGQAALWAELGYEGRGADALSVAAWREAAEESQLAGQVMLFKQIRADRVLRPI